MLAKVCLLVGLLSIASAVPAAASAGQVPTIELVPCQLPEPRLDLEDKPGTGPGLGIAPAPPPSPGLGVQPGGDSKATLDPSGTPSGDLQMVPGGDAGLELVQGCTPSPAIELVQDCLRGAIALAGGASASLHFDGGTLAADAHAAASPEVTLEATDGCLRNAALELLPDPGAGAPVGGSAPVIVLDAEGLFGHCSVQPGPVIASFQVAVPGQGGAWWGSDGHLYTGVKVSRVEVHRQNVIVGHTCLPGLMPHLHTVRTYDRCVTCPLQDPGVLELAVQVTPS